MLSFGISLHYVLVNTFHWEVGNFPIPNPHVLNLIELFQSNQGWRALARPVRVERMVTSSGRATCRGSSRGSRRSESGRLIRSWKSWQFIRVAKQTPHANATVGRIRTHLPTLQDQTLPRPPRPHLTLAGPVDTPSPPMFLTFRCVGQESKV